MCEILFLSHRIPFPPDRGDKIRSHHILTRLAEIAPVHVATFADDEFDLAEEEKLAEIAASYKLVRRSKPLVLAGMQALALHSPVSLTAFHSAALKSYITEVLATRTICSIYAFSGQMGQYVPDSFMGRVIVDFVDVDSAKFDAYAARKAGLRSWIDGREGRVLRAEEARLADRAHVSLLISDAEVALFKSRLPDAVRAKAAVRSLPNGIDSASFDPAKVEGEPRMLECAGPRLIFTGQMDYAPNIDAANRVMNSILPLVRKKIPGPTFHVVGRNPPAELLAHHGMDGCHVWGRVPDIRTWLKAADAALVPLDIGRGVQNKVLEAMSMALPVVLTPEAATGIGAEDGLQFQVESDESGLADAVVALMNDRHRARVMGAAARDYVVDKASWPAALSSLREIVCARGGLVRDAA